MQDDDDDEYDFLDPIRVSITALAYMLWNKEEDLPPHIEEAIDQVMVLVNAERAG